MGQQFIMIENAAGSVSRISLEKLGLSTKRNDTETIGRFGSGIKFAPISALRNGWRCIFTGTDNNGEYCLEYKTEIEDGIDCVIYDYGDYQKASSFTVDAGVLSWDNAFQIYREAVSNAMDGAKESGDPSDWRVSIVSETDIAVCPGRFRVYITASPDMIKIHNEFDAYFSTNRHVICEAPLSSYILEKYDNALRVYSHNVLVYQSDVESLFDYRFDNIELNEERTIKSEFSLNYMIARSIVTDRRLARTFLLNIHLEDSVFEFSIPESNFAYVELPQFWMDEFENQYGTNRVLVTPEQVQDGLFSLLRSQGYREIVVNNPTIKTLLTRIGVKTLKDVIGETSEYDIICNARDSKTLTNACRIVSEFIPEISDMIDQIFVFDSKNSDVLGLSIDMDKPPHERKILIDKTHIENSSITSVIGTIVHEYDHVSSGYSDNNLNGARLHRNLADERIGSMMLTYCKNGVVKQNGNCVVIDLSDLDKIGSINYVLTDSVEGSMGYLIIGSGSGQEKVIAIGCEEPFAGKAGMMKVRDDGKAFYVEMSSSIVFMEELSHG